MMNMKKFISSKIIISANKNNLAFFSTKIYRSIGSSISKNLITMQRKLFCNFTRLNFDKLSVNKPLETKNSDNQDFKLIKDEEDLKQREAEKAFIIEENIIEFSHSLNWDEVVMKSEIPVLVDCYAE